MKKGNKKVLLYEKNQMIVLYNDGMNFREIGNVLGRDKDTVKRHLLKAGIIGRRNLMTGQSSEIMENVIFADTIQNSNLGLSVGDKVVIERQTTDEQRHTIIKRKNGVIKYITDWNIGVSMQGKYITAFRKTALYTKNIRLRKVKK